MKRYFFGMLFIFLCMNLYAQKIIDDSGEVLFTLPLKKDTILYYPNGMRKIDARKIGKSQMWQSFDTLGNLTSETVIFQDREIYRDYYENGLNKNMYLYLNKSRTNFIKTIYNRKGIPVLLERYKRRKHIETRTYSGYDQYFQEEVLKKRE